MRGVIPELALTPFLGEIPGAVGAAKATASVVDLDLSEQRGNAPFVDRVTFYLEEGITLRIVHLDGFMTPFSVSATPHLFVICEDEEFRAAFADLETALRFGLTGSCER